MRIAGHSMGTPDHTVAEAIVLFREAGLDAAELVYQDDYKSGLPAGDRRAAEAARRTADAEGIPIVAITPYTTAINSLDNSAWSEAVDEFRAAIDISSVLGADRIRVYAGSWHPGDSDHEGHWSQLRRALETLAPVAAEAGVALCVENHFGTMTQTAADTAKLVRSVAAPSVRVLYDQTNLTFTHDENWQQALELQGELIGHVHVKDLVFTDPDAPFRAAETARVAAEERAVRSRVVGDGIMPWSEILPAVEALGYHDVLTLEYEYRWHPQDLEPPSQGFKRGAQAVRAILATTSAGAER